MFDRELEIIAHDPKNPGFGFVVRVTRGDVEIASIEVTENQAKALIQQAITAAIVYETQNAEDENAGVPSTYHA